jgi:carboxypeptidase Taq
MTTTITELRTRLAQIQDLRSAAELLGWDQQTKMPPRGAHQRAETIATVARISHEQFTDPEIGRLLEDAAAELNGDDPDSDDARIVLRAAERWNKARMVPDELEADMARAGSMGQEAWVSAREADDFAAFAPYLQRNIDLARRYVECFSANKSYECAYDALLDDFDPGTRTADVKRLFDELKGELVPLIADVAQHGFDTSITSTPFAVDSQRQLVAEVLERMGFDRSGWRLDDTVHPFAASVGAGDVRVTTRYFEDYFPTALFGAMHETGHGLYAAGVAPELQRTPLEALDSMSLHESQSRLWENMVGRGKPFSHWVAPRIAALAGGALSDLDGDTLFRVVNRVTPSLIRIEADEATYSLHVILRFEFEQELIEGRLAVLDLPEAWNARMHDYLGVRVPNDADGVLQDVHWSGGLFGYFPTYALGNLISGQLWHQARIDLPDLDDQLAAADCEGLRSWLGEHVHRHGSKFTSRELLERVVGGPIAVAPYVSYLKEKLSDVYGMDLA